MKIRLSFFQNISILSYLFYIKRNFCKNIDHITKKILSIKFLRIKKELKNVFFHDKVNLVSELLLFSLDLKTSLISIKNNGIIFKKILNQTNFVIIQKLGTGANINLTFCILCKFWVCYKKSDLSSSRQKSSLLCVFSKEDREQLISILFLISNIFYLKIIEEETTQCVLKNKNYLIKLFSKKFSSDILGSQTGRTLDSVFIKGEYFLPDYHLPFFKMKNLNSFKKKNIQRILMFREKMYDGGIRKYKLPNYLKFIVPSKFTDFFCNQILDISGNQFGKVHRLIRLGVKLDHPKAIISSSWGRCLLFCSLIIKLIHKIKLQPKNLEIIKTKKKLFLVLKVEGNVICFFCTILNSNIMKNFKIIIFYDIFPTSVVKICFLKFYRILKLVNLNIYFITSSNKTWFFKGVKTFSSIKKSL